MTIMSSFFTPAAWQASTMRLVSRSLLPGKPVSMSIDCPEGETISRDLAPSESTTHISRVFAAGRRDTNRRPDQAAGKMRFMAPIVATCSAGFNRLWRQRLGDPRRQLVECKNLIDCRVGHDPRHQSCVHGVAGAFGDHVAQQRAAQ